MSKKNTDEIVVLLDTSGSMADQVADVKGAFASFIADQRKVEGRKATLTLWTFNSPHCIKIEWENLDLDRVVELELKPHGNTALLDAVCISIDSTGDRYARLPEASRPEKVIFMIITDGEENASKRFIKSDVLSRIKHQQDNYKWIFHFVGPDPSLFEEQIPRHQTVSYDQGRIGETYSHFSGLVRNSRVS